MRARSCESQGACHSGEVRDGLGGLRSGEGTKEPQAIPGSSDPASCGRPGQRSSELWTTRPKPVKSRKFIKGGGGQRVIAAFAAASVHEEPALDNPGRWAFATGIPQNAFSHPLWPAAWSAVKTAPGWLGASSVSASYSAPAICGPASGKCSAHTCVLRQSSHCHFPLAFLNQPAGPCVGICCFWCSAAAASEASATFFRFRLWLATDMRDDSRSTSGQKSTVATDISDCSVAG